MQATAHDTIRRATLKMLLGAVEAELDTQEHAEAVDKAADRLRAALAILRDGPMTAAERGLERPHTAILLEELRLGLDERRTAVSLSMMTEIEVEDVEAELQMLHEEERVKRAQGVRCILWSLA